MLYRVLPTGHEYFLSKILFTPVNGVQELVAAEVHAEDEYNRLTAAFASQQWSYAKLRFDVYDEIPHKSSEKSVSSTISQQVTPATNNSAVLPAPTAKVAGGRSACCATHQGKKEIEALLSKFMTDFGSVISSTFGDEMNPALEAPATPSSEADRSANTDRAANDIHPRISCNYCGGQVRGIRYKCNQCADYDLCEDCVSKQHAKEVHISNCEQDHSFFTIPPPGVALGTLSAEAPARAVHLGVTCDKCQKQIVGDRHKCLDCPDYDLCEACILESGMTHPLHEFIKLAEPGRVLVHTVGGENRKASHNASCDLCDSRIRGDRFKCTNCPDFDVCARCFIIAPEQHPTHVFVKVRDPADIMAGRVPSHYVSHPASCNICKKMIVGIRYKCLHPSCDDFDLCMNCEALPIPVHPDTHPLCKIKSNAVTSASLIHLANQAIRNTQHESIVSAADNSSLREAAPETPKADQLPLTINHDSGATVEKSDQVSSVESVHPIMIETESSVAASLPDVKIRPELRAAFLSDNNMEDGVVIAPGAEFVKSWKLINSGNVVWPSGTELVFVAGDRMAAFEGAPVRYEVGSVAPGEIIDVCASDMKAPDEAGRYVSHWSLKDPMGRLFGDKIWCDFVVPEMDSEDSSHSGSVILPVPLRGQNTNPQSSEVGLAPASSSMPTEPPSIAPSTSSHTGGHEDVEGASESSASENWEDTGSIGSAFEDAPAQTGLAQALEYVVLYDSESSDDA